MAFQYFCEYRSTARSQTFMTKYFKNLFYTLKCPPDEVSNKVPSLVREELVRYVEERWKMRRLKLLAENFKMFDYVRYLNDEMF